MMGKIMIVHPEGNVNNNPNLTGMVEILCEQGFGVDIYSPRNPSMPQQSPCAGARLILSDQANKFDFSALLPLPVLEDSGKLITYIAENIPRYDLIIGVDRGIIEAGIIASQKKIPYSLLSYEILFTEETGAEYKNFDVQFSRNVSFAICQDRVRSYHLSREYGIPLDRIIVVPVAGRKAKGSGERHYILHDALGLERDKKIALYTGSVTSIWSGVNELIETADNWDDSWVLVLHHRYGQQDRSLVGRIQNLKKKNVFISPFNTLPFDELHKVIQSADVGVGFYIPQMEGTDITCRNNIRYIGMASGKTSTYLQCGLPLLINKVGEMSEHVVESRLGAVSDSFRDLPGILSSLTRDDLTSFRTNCIDFFSRRLDLDTTIKPLLNVINVIVRRQNTVANAAEKKCHVQPVGSTLVLPSLPPRITIVTPAFNQGEFLEECIDSILSQNYPNLEYIVMDGGSTDDSVRIIKKYEKYLAYWQSRPDGGQYRAINEGFGRSTGDIMAWLNSDDKYHPAALTIVAETFAHFPCTSWLMGRPTVWDEEGQLVLVLDHLPQWSREKYLRGEIGPPHIQQESTFWRRSLWDRAGGTLDLELRLAGDMELWARFFRHAQLFTIDALLGGFRVHPAQKSANFMDQYNEEATRVIDREMRIFTHGRQTGLLPAPLPIRLDDVLDRASLTPSPGTFDFFTYSRKAHFSLFRQHAPLLYGREIDENLSDLKVYQDLLVYSFITANIPKGARILEIGGGDSRVLRAIAGEYECWNLDKCEGIGSGPTTVTHAGYRLVRDYIGTYSQELPDSYFDLIFSISVLEHIPENEETFAAIRRDMNRVMKPGALSLHCFDVIFQQAGIWTNSLLHYLFSTIQTSNRFIPFHHLGQDPSLYVMTEEAYRAHWMGVTKKLYQEFGMPLSYNILWAKPAEAASEDYRAFDTGGQQYAIPVLDSTYNSADFIRKCLGDPVAQTSTEQIEDRVHQAHELDQRSEACANGSKLLRAESDFVKECAGKNGGQFSNKKGTSDMSLLKGDNVQESQRSRNEEIRVTVIVSSYNAEQFMRECLTDLVNQTIADQMEIIVVDAASPQAEGPIVADFQGRHDNITYIRTGTRIGVYAAWNMAIRLARGRYITPFSTNDRLRRDAYEIMVESLDIQQDVMLVYGDSYKTEIPHETFESHTRCGAFQWPDYSYEDLLRCCLIGPHPMWRKSVHETIGFYDESFSALGDQDFFIRLGAEFKMLHIPQFTGLYWLSESGLSNREELYLPEIQRIRKKYVSNTAIDADVVSPERRGVITGGAASRVEMERLKSLAITKKGERRFEEAFDLFLKVRSSGDMSVLVNIGDCLANQGRLDEAAEYYRDALSHDSDNAQAHIGIGVQKLMAGKYSEAAISFTKALRSDPDNAKALCGLGMARNGQGHKNAGYGYFVKALKADPENITALNELFRAAYDSGKYTDAIACARKYLMYHPADLDMLFSLAGVLFKMDKGNEALEQLDTILVFDPEFEGAWEMRQLIGNELQAAV